MFVFQSKRSGLVKRLWKASLKLVSAQSTEEMVALERAYKSTLHSILKRISDDQLELLLRSVESNGEDLSECVQVSVKHVSRSSTPDGCCGCENWFQCERSWSESRSVSSRCSTPEGSKPEPHLVMCTMFRWSDMETPLKLRRLPSSCCHEEVDKVCCNPYHWSKEYSYGFTSLTTLLESSRQRSCSERTSKINRLNSISQQSTYSDVKDCLSHSSPSSCSTFDVGDAVNVPEFSSVATGGTHDQSSAFLKDPGHWATLAYWEGTTRVGRLCPISSPAVCITATPFELTPPEAPTLSLCSLAKGCRSSDASCKTRDKIGPGIVLWYDGPSVLLYNRSKYPVFVTSTLLASTDWSVHRIPCGNSVIVYDYRISDKNGPNSVTVSFAKGWGPGYSRRCVTSCPCWLEILLVPER